MRGDKQIKRLIREYAGKAHELDLRQALVPLAEAFRQWERGEVDSFELSNLIHRFHQDDAREIYLRYDRYPETGLAGAIAAGVVPRETVPAELLEELSGMIAHFNRPLAAEDPDPPLVAPDADC